MRLLWWACGRRTCDILVELAVEGFLEVGFGHCASGVVAMLKVLYIYAYKDRRYLSSFAMRGATRVFGEMFTRRWVG